MKQKEDILASPIKSRSKAHEMIKNMLASLGDQYSRFLTQDEFSRESKYDITGIGINLEEVSDGDGNIKLKVSGIVLDSYADNAGETGYKPVRFCTWEFCVLLILEVFVAFLCREMKFLLLMKWMLVGNHHLKYHLCYKDVVKLMCFSRL